MKVYPAIDIKQGRCVRLLQGRAERETVYYDDPLEPARAFLAEGATWVHVVDLDGAFTGNSTNLEVIRGVVALGLKVQMGGGLRDMQSVDRVLNAGVARAVIGTRACREPEFAKELVAAFGDRIAVGIDANDGKVAVQGWTETTDRDVVTLARQLEGFGVCTIIHTDIATDGMMIGPNLAAQEALLSQVSLNIIASGGVGSDDHLHGLKSLARRYANLDGVIVGKALYERTIRLADWL
jgi:phosphoribosylformimino-5-aminoimidazole carboxamide ribotide isomerase